LATGPVNCTDAPRTISLAEAEPDGIVKAAATSKRADRLGDDTKFIFFPASSVAESE
jgi:hypothetical protein